MPETPFHRTTFYRTSPISGNAWKNWRLRSRRSGLPGAHEATRLPLASFSDTGAPCTKSNEPGCHSTRAMARCENHIGIVIRHRSGQTQNEIPSFQQLMRERQVIGQSDNLFTSRFDVYITLCRSPPRSLEFSACGAPRLRAVLSARSSVMRSVTVTPALLSGWRLEALSTSCCAPARNRSLWPTVRSATPRCPGSK